MIVCLIVVWLIVWKWLEIENFLKVEWEGIKGLSQNFASCILIFLNSNSFHHKTLEWRWYDFFHLKKWKGVWKWFEIPFWNISNLESLSNSMSSWGKIKWLLHIWRKRVGSFKEINWRSLWSCLKLQIQIQLGVIWVPIQIIFLLKINKWK